jgi:DNA-directed RNA polymerase II subunit RPB7
LPYRLQIELEHETLVHPIYFGPDLMNVLMRKVYQEVEGTCSGHTGYIISITSLTRIFKGLIVHGGMAQYTVKYNAIVFRPIKNEVLDGVVKVVNKLGVFVDVGPMPCFISHNSMPSEFKFRPEDNPPCYKSDDHDCIAAEDIIRLRVLGVRVDNDKMFAIGTLMDDFLGILCP